jgi:alkanesulfonate monooxygenase SsuD/methylene tetrahydromethanopterin reductase-like flavin-dependent oxidoreductase (luciferase family)
MTGFSPTEQVAETFAYFRQYAREHCGWEPAPEQMGINRHVYVAPTDAQARAEADGFMELEAARNTERSFSYKALPHAGRPQMGPRDAVDCERLLREGYCIVGSPDTVTRAIKEQGRLTGAGVMVTYLPWGDMRVAQARHSLELFAKEVLPQL